jgi:pimeloyl-ACP methyl ester carboxylesterase
MKRVAVTGLVASLVLMPAGLGWWWQERTSRRDRARFPPPGQLVDVGDHRLHLNVTGEPTSSPTVLLEAGIGSFSSNWAWVRDELARDGRVVSYDRAGLGWSERGAGSLAAGTAAEELHTALREADVGPPYLLAGHSYGGLVTRMFTHQYRDEVVGIVLVDSSHPDQWAHITASRDGRTVALGNRMTAAVARFGLLRLFHAERSFIAGLPPREYAEMRAYLARPQGWSVAADALLAWSRVSRRQVNATRPLGDLPLAVLSVTEQDRYGEVLTRLQAELATLSSNCRHVTVEGATHYTLVSEQAHAAVVTAAVRAVAAAIRTNGPVPAFGLTGPVHSDGRSADGPHDGCGGRGHDDDDQERRPEH